MDERWEARVPGLVQIGAIAGVIAVTLLTGGGASLMLAYLVSLVATVVVACVIWPLNDAFAAFRPVLGGGRAGWWRTGWWPAG